jgi:hypothetical protein
VGVKARYLWHQKEIQDFDRCLPAFGLYEMREWFHRTRTM